MDEMDGLTDLKMDWLCLKQTVEVTKSEETNTHSLIRPSGSVTLSMMLYEWFFRLAVAGS